MGLGVARWVVRSDWRAQHVATDRVTKTDQNGHFVLRAVEPGDYVVYSWDKAENGAWLDPEFMTKYEDSGAKVRIGESEKKQVAATMIVTRTNAVPAQ